MTHLIDGLSVRFTHCGSWKAWVWARGMERRLAPVAWRRDFCKDPDSDAPTQLVWFRSDAEVKEARSNPNPILIVVAEARDYEEFPYRIREFVSVFEGVPLEAARDDRGRERGVEYQLIRRVRADTLAARQS
jgi:hypothetical protein